MRDPSGAGKVSKGYMRPEKKSYLAACEDGLSGLLEGSSILSSYCQIPGQALLTLIIKFGMIRCQHIYNLDPSEDQD